MMMGRYFLSTVIILTLIVTNANDNNFRLSSNSELASPNEGSKEIGQSSLIINHEIQYVNYTSTPTQYSPINFSLSDISSPIVWSPDGSKIIFSSSRAYTKNASIFVWDLINETLLFNITTNYFYTNIKTIAWSPDGSKIALGTDDGGSVYDEVVILNASTSFPILVYPEFPNPGDVKSITWSPDSSRIAFYRQKFEDGSFNRSVEVLNVNTMEVQIAIYDPLVDFPLVKWSPDGTRIAIGSDNGEIYIWDVETKSNIRVLFYPGWFESLTWHPEGEMLISTSYNQSNSMASMIIWNVTDGTYNIIIEGLKRVNSASWSQDGKIISYSDGDKIYFMNINESILHSIPFTGLRGLLWNPVGNILGASNTTNLIFFEFPVTTIPDPSPTTTSVYETVFDTSTLTTTEISTQVETKTATENYTTAKTPFEIIGL